MNSDDPLSQLTLAFGSASVTVTPGEKVFVSDGI